MKSLIPVVMAGILGIYGMIVAVIITQRGSKIIIQLNQDKDIPKEMDSLIWLLVWSADLVVL